jgi:hypothetical protein
MKKKKKIPKFKQRKKRRNNIESFKHKVGFEKPALMGLRFLVNETSGLL